MTLRRCLFAAIIALGLSAQNPVEFEVASIKPAPAGATRSGIGGDKGLWRATNVTAKFLIQVAFDVLPDQVLGGPSWIDADRFDIQAKAEVDPTISRAQASMNERIRMQSLLASRFHLAVHREIKDWPAYVLVVAKKGSKLTPTTRKEGFSIFSNNGHLEATGVGMDQFAKNLTNRLGRPVVNQTSLAGKFDFTMEFDPEQSASGAGTESTKPSLFTAVQEQLGLKLESRKAPVEMLIVDKIEKPGEN